MGDDGEGSIWQGADVRLRAVEPGDWEVFHAWDFDDEGTRASDRLGFPRAADETRKWAEAAAARGAEGDAFRWVIEDRAVAAVGTINTHSVDRRAGTFSYGVYISPAARHRGLAAEAIELVLRFYFEELRYQKADVHVYAFNEASAALHERLGFQLEGRLRRMLFTGGRHHDVLAYGLTVEEFAERRGLPFGAPVGADAGGGPAGR